MIIDATDVTLALARWLLVVVLFVHGTQKSLGWFRGPGLRASEGIFAALGQRPARPMVLLASTCEIAAAVLLAVGLATPLACAMAAGTLFVAAGSQTLVARAFANAKGGGEYPAALAVLALALAPAAGAISIDRALGMPWSSLDAAAGVLVFIGATVLAALAATPPLLMARATLSHRVASD